MLITNSGCVVIVPQKVTSVVINWTHHVLFSYLCTINTGLFCFCLKLSPNGSHPPFFFPH